jgi:ribosomal protein L44E
VSDHPLLKSNVMTMVCKKCKKAFRKDVKDMEVPDKADEYCPHCDNHFLREAVTRGAVVGRTQVPATEDVRKDTNRYICSRRGANRRIVPDERVQGAGIQAKLDSLVDTSGRLG